MESTNIKKPLFISHIIVAINVIIFVALIIIQMKFTTDLSVKTLIHFGAKVNYKIADGQWYRLITPMFLHSDIYHLLFNCIALISLGPDIEIFFGKTKFLIIYFFSGFMGTIASLVFNDVVCVGASGAIFGLVGANLFLMFLNPAVYKKIYGSNILILLAINLVYGFLNSHIDNSAHLGGMIGGHLIAWTIGIKNVTLEWKKRLWALVLIIAILSFSLYNGVIAYKSSPRYDLSKAKILIAENQLPLAYLQLQNGLAKDPDNEEILYWLSLFTKNAE